MSMSPDFNNFQWAPEVDPQLQKMDAIPLTGRSPPFSWEELSERMAGIFECQGLKIEAKEIKWRTTTEFYEGMGEHYFQVVCAMPALHGQVSWIIAEQENAVLAALLLTKQADPIYFQDPLLNDSFLHFIALEVIYQFTELLADRALMPIVSHQTSFTSEAALCIEIALSYGQQSVWSRLMISPELQRSWVIHFAKLTTPSHSEQVLMQTIALNVHIELGHTYLAVQEWNKINEGDILLLDDCSLDAYTFGGQVFGTINDGKHCFKAVLNNNELKITDSLALHEVEKAMVNNISQESDQNDDHDNEDSFSGLDFSVNEEDLGELSEELNESTTGDSSISQNLTQEVALDLTQNHTPDLQDQSSIAVQSTQPETQIASVAKIPMKIVVELCQIQMPMEQIIKLEAGNLLTLNHHPKDGVNLTVNGCLIGRGELIRVGEALGVRILEIGQ